MRKAACVLLLLLALAIAAPARASHLNLPLEATEGLRMVYNGDPDAGIERFRILQKQNPDHPLGYLLEANALWWKLYCHACGMKYGMVDAWHRARLPEDNAYLALTEKAVKLAEMRLQQDDTAEMHFYAGMSWLLRGRLLGLRDDRRGTARSGVRAREHLLRAIELDPDMADAYTGLGLYNYYVDTLSSLAKVLRFFMGIPGGDKKEGMRQLERAMKDGELTAVEARFYLAKNLRNYNHQYERAVEVFEPLVKEFPQNPVFVLLLGDTHAKLSRKEKAAACFREAEKLALRDSVCQARVRALTQQSLAALRESAAAQPSR